MFANVPALFLFGSVGGFVVGRAGGLVVGLLVFDADVANMT